MSIAAYLSALAVLVVLDALWLGRVALPLYRREIGALLRPKPLLLPAALFYLGYPLALVVLALQPLQVSAWDAAWRGAVVGALAYGTYELTNLATLKGWSLRLALVDGSWGTAVSAVAAVAAWWAIA